MILIMIVLNMVIAFKKNRNKIVVIQIKNNLKIKYNSFK